MFRTTLTWALLCTRAFSAGLQINVAVCDFANISPRAMERAKSETAYLFRTAAVEIDWISCAEADAAAKPGPVFVVRVRRGVSPSTTDSTSLEAMGRAYLSGDGSGQLADVYYGAIQQLTALYPAADSDQVLGCTIVHELGHLLLGRGHPSNGLMRASWGKKELDAIHQRRLKFNRAELAAIPCRLSPAANPACNIASGLIEANRAQADSRGSLRRR